MLIRFEVENFRSIAEPVELSMVAVDKDRDSVVPVELLKESLLKVSAIYGPNASGKSNVVAALAWLTLAISESVRFWDDGIPRDPFAFGDGPNKPSRFVLELTVDGVRFEYQLELTDEAVLWEALYHYPMRVRRKVFERDGQNLSFQRGVEGLPGTKQLLTPRTLVLSVAPRFGDPLVAPFSEQVRRIDFRGASLDSNQWGPGKVPFLIFRRPETPDWFRDDAQESLPGVGAGVGDRSENTVPRRTRALALLRLADLGIEDVEIDYEAVPLPDWPKPLPIQRVKLQHRTAQGLATLDLAVESEGTKNWFNLIGTALDALEWGNLLVFDELDASLHPTLSAALVGLFKRQDTNPLGAQLLFTSHDTSLLNHLNRDEVWLTEKNDEGATRLGSIAEFAGERVRTSTNLERGYLGGRFGALPEINQVDFLRALGLIG